MKTHELKTWPKYFQAVVDRKKTFELRVNDRDFKVGDILLLQEWVPCSQCNGSGRVWDVGDRTSCGECLGEKTLTGYTGREISAEVTYKIDGSWGVKEGFSVLAFIIVDEDLNYSWRKND